MSINLLTLFALVLAIGIVVDDAMVVIENVERIMETEHVSAKVAADRAIRQLAARTDRDRARAVLGLRPGSVPGGHYGSAVQAVRGTIVISVVLSGIVALTLTPALCSLLLEPGRTVTQRGFFAWFNRTFDRCPRRICRCGAAARGAAKRADWHVRAHDRRHCAALSVAPDRLSPDGRQGLFHYWGRAAGVGVSRNAPTRW